MAKLGWWVVRRLLPMSFPEKRKGTHGTRVPNQVSVNPTRYAFSAPPNGAHPSINPVDVVEVLMFDSDSSRSYIKLFELGF